MVGDRVGDRFDVGRFRRLVQAALLLGVGEAMAEDLVAATSDWLAAFMPGDGLGVYLLIVLVFLLKGLTSFTGQYLAPYLGKNRKRKTA